MISTLIYIYIKLNVIRNFSNRFLFFFKLLMRILQFFVFYLIFAYYLLHVKCAQFNYLLEAFSR